MFQKRKEILKSKCNLRIGLLFLYLGYKPYSQVFIVNQPTLDFERVLYCIVSLIPIEEVDTCV